MSEPDLDRRLALMLAGGMALAAAPAGAAPSPALQAELTAAFGDFTRRLNARDYSALDLFDGDDALMIGSAAGEVCLGREAIRGHLAHYWALPERIGFEWQRTMCGPAGDRGAWLWSEGEVVVTDEHGQAQRAPYRATCVLVRRGKAWRLRLFSGSEVSKD